MNTLFTLLLFCTAIIQIQTTKLDGASHNHHHHHHDTNHNNHHHDTNQMSVSFSKSLTNKDVFAEALANEVTNGLFSPLPHTSKQSTPHNTLQATLHNKAFQKKKQEQPTQVNSVRRIGKASITAKNAASEDTTGFVPREPPSHAKQFNPFAAPNSQSTGKNPQQLSNFKFRSNSKRRNGIRRNRGKSIARNRATQNSLQVVTTTENIKVATDNPIIEGFLPSTPSPWANKFNPVPGAEKMKFNFNNQELEETTALSNTFTVDYDSDFNLGANFGKSLFETRSPKVRNNLQSQQIGVLGALRSTDNILNSPKYDKSGKADLKTRGRSRVSDNLSLTPPPVRLNSGRQLFETNGNSLTVLLDRSIEAPDFKDSREVADDFSDYGFDSYDDDLDDRFDSDENRIGIGRQLNNNFRDSGEYPRLSSVPETSFSCLDHSYGGYFADPETDCQAFHICHNTRNLGSFLCPNGTLFHQRLFVCDWWYNVDCAQSEGSYDLNKRIGAQDRSEELTR